MASAFSAAPASESYLCSLILIALSYSISFARNTVLDQEMILHRKQLFSQFWNCWVSKSSVAQWWNVWIITSLKLDASRPSSLVIKPVCCFVRKLQFCNRVEWPGWETYVSLLGNAVLETQDLENGSLKDSSQINLNAPVLCFNESVRNFIIASVDYWIYSNLNPSIFLELTQGKSI